MPLRIALGLVCLTLLADFHLAQSQNSSFDENCAGNGAVVRQLLLYSLRSTDAESVKAVTKLFQQRLSECEALLYPGGSYGGPAISTSRKVFGFPPSRPMPVTAALADWAGWMDFAYLDDVRACLAINNSTGTLQAMRAYAQPNGRFDLVLNKSTLPGNKHAPCPFPGSYAPATVRYVWVYLLPRDANRTRACRQGTALWHRALKTVGLDVRHGTGCSLLSDADAREYGIMFNSAFGGYADFEAMRDMTRVLATNNPQAQRDIQAVRRLLSYVVRSAVALPWSG